MGQELDMGPGMGRHTRPDARMGQELEQAKNKHSILLEKKTKHEEDIVRLTDELARIRKRIESLDVRIKKLKVGEEEKAKGETTIKEDNMPENQTITKEDNIVKENIEFSDSSGDEEQD